MNVEAIKKIASRARTRLGYGSHLWHAACLIPDTAIWSGAIRIGEDRIERVECGRTSYLVIEIDRRLYMGDPDASLMRSTPRELNQWASEQDLIGCWRGQGGCLHYYADGAPGDAWVVVARADTEYAAVTA